MARGLIQLSSIEKELYCISLGAIRVVKQEKCNILEVLGENSMDVVLDSVGGEYLDVNLNLLRTEDALYISMQ
jgi:NADPH:quinone reductase-like Zn-dependent oxidoreductase